MDRLLVIGHSFVRRLRYEIDRLGLGVQEYYSTITVRGVSEMRVDEMRAHLPYIRTTRPSVVFMDIGTYDLVAPDCDPAELAREIVSTAVDFSLVGSVKHVVISEILRRKDKRRLDFNNARMLTNLQMRRLAADHPSVHTCRHRGLTCNWEQYLNDDGLFLTPHGMNTYRMNIRKVVRHYAK